MFKFFNFGQMFQDYYLTMESKRRQKSVYISYYTMNIIMRMALAIYWQIDDVAYIVITFFLFIEWLRHCHTLYIFLNR